MCSDRRRQLLTVPTFEKLNELFNIFIPLDTLDIEVNEKLNKIYIDGEVVKNTRDIESLLDIKLSVETFNKLENRLFSPKKNKRTKFLKIYKQELCTICMDKKPIVMLECGHECFCETCSHDWLFTKSECPICKSKIEKAYLL